RARHDGDDIGRVNAIEIQEHAVRRVAAARRGRRDDCRRTSRLRARDMDKRTELKEKALKDLQRSEVLLLNGNFDDGNGYHCRVYVNAHQLFRHPSTIWRFAQDLIDVMPGDLVQRTEVVAGPVTGGALLAHTIAGLLDSRRALTHPPCSFAPFNSG